MVVVLCQFYILFIVFEWNDFWIADNGISLLRVILSRYLVIAFVRGMFFRSALSCSNASAKAVSLSLPRRVLNGSTVKGETCAWLRRWSLRSAISSSIRIASSIVLNVIFFFPFMSFHDIDGSVGMPMVWIEFAVFLLVVNWITFHIFIICSILLIFIIVLFAVIIFSISIADAPFTRWRVLICAASSLICLKLYCACLSCKKMSDVLIHVMSILSYRACCILCIVFVVKCLF